MRILLATTFRNFDKSLEIVNQLNFLKSINKFSDEIDLCVTQFGEKNVKKSIYKNFSGKIIYQNIKTKKYKWSHSEVFKFALKKSLKRNYDYIGWCSSDIEFDKNFFLEIKKFNELSMITYFPNISNRKKNLLEFGIDLFFFRVSNKDKIKMIKLLNQFPNYNWGIFEHYLFAFSEIFKLKKINLRSKAKVFKRENIVNKKRTSNNYNSWLLNKIILENMLKKNKISLLFANGSMYFLAYKLINLNNLSFEMIIIYLKLSLKLVLRILNGK